MSCTHHADGSVDVTANTWDSGNAVHTYCTCRRLSACKPRGKSIGYTNAQAYGLKRQLEVQRETMATSKLTGKPRPTCSKSGCMHGHCVPHLHRQSHSSRTTTALKANRWTHLPMPVLLRAKTRAGATSGTKRCSGSRKKRSQEHGTPEANHPHGQTTRTTATRQDVAPTKAARRLPGNWCPSPFIAAWRQESRQAPKPKPRMQRAPMQNREKQNLASKLPPLAKPTISTFGADQRTRAHEGGGVAIATPLAIRATGHRSHVAAKPQTAVRRTPRRHTKAHRSVKVNRAAPTTACKGASHRQRAPGRGTS